MPPAARPTKSPPPQRPKGTPSKAAGKAKAGKATDAAAAMAEPDDEVDAATEAVNGQASSSTAKSPAKVTKGSKVPPAAKAPTAARSPSAPAAKAPPVAVGAFLVLLLALAAGAYTVLKPNKLKPVPTLGPNAFDGLSLKLSGGHTGVAMVGFWYAAALLSCPVLSCLQRDSLTTTPAHPRRTLTGSRCRFALRDKSCSGCKQFNRVLKEAATPGLLERLQGQSLKIGKVRHH